MQQPNKGLIKRTSALLGNTLDRTDITINYGLMGIQNLANIGANMSEEFRNDSVVDLVNSRVNVATTVANGRLTLKSLGYTDEQCDSLLSVNII